jgi:hypothetical protein
VIMGRIVRRQIGSEKGFGAVWGVSPGAFEGWPP